MQFSPEVERHIETALREDRAGEDITTRALLQPGLPAKANLLVKAEGVLAGIVVAERVFRQVDPALEVNTLVPDGRAVTPGTLAARLRGDAAAILSAERVALNYLQHLSGVATLTAAFVARVGGLKARIVDTRKTVPGLREMEKYAVRMGGGHNHRMHLGDAVLIKDNHLALLRASGLNLTEIVRRAREQAPQGMEIEVEVTGLEEAKAAAAAGADTVMLDNMPPDAMREVVKVLGGKVLLEASGGINLDNVRAVAESGVDIISIGALTHSVRALDISLEMEG